MNTNDIATDLTTEYWLIDAAGDYVALATWEQLRESLNASPEGWIEHDSGRHVYADGNEAEMRSALAAYEAQVADELRALEHDDAETFGREVAQ